MCSLSAARGYTANSIQDTELFLNHFYRPCLSVSLLLHLAGPAVTGVNTHIVYFIHYLDICQGAYYC